MNTINVNAIADSRFSSEIDVRRGHALRSYFKRQSRRQVRHRLAAELRLDMPQNIADAIEMLSPNAGADHNPAVTSAQVFHFPSKDQRAAHAVPVIRKLKRSPFERQRLALTVLAA